MDAADFVGVNGTDGNGFDFLPFATGDDKHFGFVIETVCAAQHVRN